MLLAAMTRPHAPPSITVVNCFPERSSGVVVTAAGAAVDVPFDGIMKAIGVSAVGARARTMGRAKAETTMPVVKK